MTAAKIPPASKITPAHKRFLAHVGKVRDLLLAAEDSNVDWDLVQEWLKDDAFNGLVAQHQGRYLARLEADLIEMGRAKKNPMPLLAALNAHSSEYGIIKRSFLDKLLTAFIKGCVKEFKEIAPAPLLEQLSNVLIREAERASLRVPS